MLLPASQTLPLAGFFRVMLPGTWECRGSILLPPSIPESDSPHDEINIAKNKKLDFLFSNYLKCFSNCFTF